MAAKLLDGTALLETTKAQLTSRAAPLGERGITPGLGTILVGSDPNSHAYVRGKRAACEEIGMVSRHTELPESVSPEDLHATIADYNSDPRSTPLSCNYLFPVILTKKSPCSLSNPIKMLMVYTQ